jgi:HSP20 family protein
MARMFTPWRNRLPLSLGDLPAEFESLLDRFLRNGGTEVAEQYVPVINIAETDKQFEVTADLPGVRPEDVKVELHENELSISGERKSDVEEEGKSFHRIERRYGGFRRSVMLPAAVDREHIDAAFKNGVLTVTIPKSVEVMPKKIEVRAN